jgi:N utilization substance protein A
MVVSELRGEKIDIIPFNEEPARFVAKALSPARVREVLVDDEAKQATVIVPDDQLSLAIGKEGQNARLAARLTGWRVDIRSETDFAKEEAEMGFEEEDSAGRCAAILTSGRRCPNAGLPGSRYCGLPAHQELEGTGSDHVGGEPPAGEQPAAEVEETAAPDQPAAEPDAAPAADEPAAEPDAAPDEPADEPEAAPPASEQVPPPEEEAEPPAPEAPEAPAEPDVGEDAPGSEQVAATPDESAADEGTGAVDVEGEPEPEETISES